MEMKTLVLCTVLLFNCFLSSKAKALEEEAQDQRRFWAIRGKEPDEALIHDIENILRGTRKEWGLFHGVNPSHSGVQYDQDFAKYYNKNDKDDEGVPQRNPSKYIMGYDEPNEELPFSERHRLSKQENLDNIQPNPKERRWELKCEYPANGVARREQRGWTEIQEFLKLPCRNPNEKRGELSYEQDENVSGPSNGDKNTNRGHFYKCLREWLLNRECK